MFREFIDTEKRILALSDRRDHLQIMKEATDKITGRDTESGYYVGQMKQNDLDILAGKTIIYGTYNLAAEGMDISTWIRWCSPRQGRT